MSLGEGQVFAGYTVVRRLGSGGMGEVYQVEHPRLPRRDALKLLTADVAENPSFRERFLREADLASTLWHPHIVGVHDRGECDGQLWISMDFVDGEDAGSLIARKYPVGMPVEEVVTIVEAVASALDYAHTKGLLHRDVKPSNILLARREDNGPQRVLLTDFGIARSVDDNSGLTDTNMTVGTVDYASPEQLMGQELDGRADQYSLAATAYHLLTGSPPFRDSNPAVVIGRHIKASPPALSATRSELAPLEDIIAAGLAKDPDHRYPTCTDFALALRDRATDESELSAASAATGIAPIGPGHPATGTRMLAPGWYPDPNEATRSLYWNGREWHSASIPKTAGAEDEDVASRSTGRTMALPVLTASVLVLALVAVSLAIYLVVRERSSEPTPNATPAPSYVEPSMPPPTSPTTTSPTMTQTPRPTLVTPAPPVPTSPTRVLYWEATIVGTCDEGGSCGVKQRAAPYVEADRLYRNDLQDGMSVQVGCYTLGDSRASSGHGSSSIWYRLLNGA
ncbi:protein kinase [Mycobacterium sp. pV006]|uniref:serine/threonine-protein kinase n=1 Tax=Mycobacterium sp. pV006 TaxID=3238983 RepID=UPI00351B4F0A